MTDDDNSSSSSNRMSQGVHSGGTDIPMQSFYGETLQCDEQELQIKTFSRNTPKFNELMKKFLIGMGTFAFPDSIVGIHRFIPKKGVKLGRLVIFKQKFTMLNLAHGERLDIRNAWFGTSKKGMLDLMNHGFNVDLGLTIEGSYGTGVYLAPEYRAFSWYFI